MKILLFYLNLLFLNILSFHFNYKNFNNKFINYKKNFYINNNKFNFTTIIKYNNNFNTNNKNFNINNFDKSNTINYLGKNKIRHVIDQFYNNYYENNKNYNLEHIIPRSFIKNHKYSHLDLHNIILYHKNINFKKSNYKYINNIENYDFLSTQKINEYIIPINNNYNNTRNIYYINSKFKICKPYDIYLGVISRTAMYMCSTYPELSDIILNSVIDPENIILWNKMFPVNKFEIEKNNIIFYYQKNYNKYIINNSDLEKDLDFFI